MLQISKNRNVLGDTCVHTVYKNEKVSVLHIKKKNKKKKLCGGWDRAKALQAAIGANAITFNAEIIHHPERITSSQILYQAGCPSPVLPPDEL